MITIDYVKLYVIMTFEKQVMDNIENLPFLRNLHWKKLQLKRKSTKSNDKMFTLIIAYDN